MHNKELLRQLKNRRTADIIMATLLEDILSLKTLFRMCSFCLVSDDNNDISANISSYALDILLDEKGIIPPCL